MIRQSRIQSIFFDLDGTLIDSAPGILACFAAILREEGITPLLSLDHSLIGPPLRKTLQIVTGIEESNELDHLTERFKAHYDSSGYLETRVYEGVEELLSLLHQQETPLAVATNKRRIPTLKILKHLGWEHYFRLVGSLDTPVPAYPDKASLVAAMLQELNLSPFMTLYVGDKLDDGLAARVNEMPFAAAAWGYGKWDPGAAVNDWAIVRTPMEIMDLIIC